MTKKDRNFLNRHTREIQTYNGPLVDCTISCKKCPISKYIKKNNIMQNGNSMCICVMSRRMLFKKDKLDLIMKELKE